MHFLHCQSLIRVFTEAALFGELKTSLEKTLQTCRDCLQPRLLLEPASSKQRVQEAEAAGTTLTWNTAPRATLLLDNF